MNLIDRTASLARETAGRFARIGLGAANTAIGKANALRQAQAKPEMDDITLARKVETELFRDADAPKGKVDVMVVDRVVDLRGEVKNPEEKARLEAQARAIPEVRDVHNHLHLPKTPAPTRADSPGRARRRSSTASKAKPKAKTTRTAGRRTTGASKPAAAEPSPAESAAEGTGRRPAPLGAEEPSTPAPAADVEQDPSSTPPEPLDRLRGA